MVPSVNVPVLSRQMVSTRASISIQYSSCTIVLRFESLITLTASVMLVSRKGPAGIIPITLPAVLVSALIKASSLFRPEARNVV